MSILIADSGATKTEWCLVNDETVTHFTEGLNPYYHTTESIEEVIRQNLLPKIKVTIDEVFFYGAGCDSDEKDQVVQEALDSCFADSNNNVYHDLLGAARACFHHKPGIACILGTGSNSCLYDGEKIAEHIPSLAFILGDEGSAGYFGKKLINKYFRFEIPSDLKEDLEKNYNMSLDHITRELYDGDQKSRFIASYGSFLGDHADHPFIKEMLYEGFESFISRILLNYTDATDYEVRFIGSVAFAHQNLIKEILNKHDLKAGLFVKNPMDRLVTFHSDPALQKS
jgi:N-acetylglucosamine kinase-like BadF-type ATPase